MSFQERLKATRKELGLTQSAVANALGITEGAYCAYETGKREPNIEKIKKLSDLFNVSTDFLINTNLYNPNAVLNDTEKKLLDLFRDLNKEGQAYVMQTIDMVKDKYPKEKAPSINEAM